MDDENPLSGSNFLSPEVLLCIANEVEKYTDGCRLGEKKSLRKLGSLWLYEVARGQDPPVLTGAVYSCLRTAKRFFLAPNTCPACIVVPGPNLVYGQFLYRAVSFTAKQALSGTQTVYGYHSDRCSVCSNA
jgi:hypothetical protein